MQNPTTRPSEPAAAASEASGLSVRAVAGASELREARAIREAVFVNEQSCPPEVEWDGHDDVSRHLLGWVGDVPVAVARWRVVRHDARMVAKLERFAVLEGHRGRGYGRAMVRAAIDDAHAAGFEECLIHAQAHLEKYYSDLGFISLDERFVEADIPHVAMIRFTR